jgi:uncharacterized protein (TIGR03118 family)
MPTRRLFTALTLLAAGVLGLVGAGIEAASARASTSGTVLQTNLVSDLVGVAAVTDPNLVNPWGISESPTSPFWISDNGSGLSTLYLVPGAGNTSVSINPLAVNVPILASITGATPTGTVFNPSAAFPVTGLNRSGQATSSPAVFLFATEDGTIAGWNPGIDPSGQFSGPNGTSTDAVIAVDRSQSDAVYKGLAIDTSDTPIVPGDADSTALLYASNFRAGTIEVYDAKLNPVMALTPGAFADPGLPAGYAPFNVQVLDGKVYVTYARQDAARQDDAAGPHRGFVDVFNPDGTPGLAAGRMRLISRGELDSPWGLAIAPPGFAGLGGLGGGQVLLVGNFGDGRIHAFDATTGSEVGQLTDPDGEPIVIGGLWELKVGNGGAGGIANTVYFTAGPFDESHGLFGSLTTVAPGSPEGPAEEQWVQASLDAVQLDLQRLLGDASGGAPRATIRHDIRILDADSRALARAERDFAHDAVDDATS